MTLGSTVDFNSNDRRAIAWDERRCRERLEAMPAGGADSQHGRSGLRDRLVEVQRSTREAHVLWVYRVFSRSTL